MPRLHHKQVADGTWQRTFRLATHDLGKTPPVHLALAPSLIAATQSKGEISHIRRLTNAKKDTQRH